MPSGDEAEAPARERRGARGGRHRGEPREDRPKTDRHPERGADSRRHHAERPAQERVAAEKERQPIPAGATPSAPRRSRSLRNRKGAPAPRPAPVRFADPSPRREAARPRRDDEPVIGLGDHVPSFLLRPVPKRARHPHDHERIEAEE